MRRITEIPRILLFPHTSTPSKMPQAATQSTNRPIISRFGQRVFNKMQYVNSTDRSLRSTNKACSKAKQILISTQDTFEQLFIYILRRIPFMTLTRVALESLRATIALRAGIPCVARRNLVVQPGRWSDRIHPFGSDRRPWKRSEESHRLGY